MSRFTLSADEVSMTEKFDYDKDKLDSKYTYLYVKT